MKSNSLIIIALLSIVSLTACSQKEMKSNNENDKLPNLKNKEEREDPHPYAGWYCPDNLTNFPPVNFNDWKNIPIVNGRMATKEEAQNGTSLIFVDMKKYKDTKPLDIQLPKLAYFNNQSTNRKELIIVIQALKIENDSIVGFRYMNGGNGSSELREVKFLTEKEVVNIPKSRFVFKKITINASQEKISKVITGKETMPMLVPIFDKENKLAADWREKSNINFKYSKAEELNASYNDILYGNFYIQNDYEVLNYSEKFLLLEDHDTKLTELKIVCGPFTDDFEEQQIILDKWAKKVKKLSENNFMHFELNFHDKKGCKDPK